MPGRQAGALAAGGLGIGHPPQAVVQGRELHAGLGELALHPLMAVAPAPHRVGGIRADLDEPRAPVVVPDVEVPVVDVERLAAVDEMRVAVAAPATEPPPAAGHTLLGLADEDHPGGAGPLGCLQEGPGGLFFGGALLEAHDL